MTQAERFWEKVRADERIAAAIRARKTNGEKWQRLSDEALAGEIARLAADVLRESMSVALNRGLLRIHLGELEQRLSRRLRSAADDTAIKEEATP